MHDPHTHGNDHHHPHGHGGHEHTHEHMDHAGHFHQRAMRLDNRDFKQRAFTIGVGGPVGSGKTALMLALCRGLRDRFRLGVVTNDIFTREDGEFLIAQEALETHKIRAIETGGCPHAAIREDISGNLLALEELTEGDNVVVSAASSHNTRPASVFGAAAGVPLVMVTVTVAVSVSPWPSSIL